MGFVDGEDDDLVNGRLLAVERVFGVFAPVVGGGDDVTENERLLAGGREEAFERTHGTPGG